MHERDISQALAERENGECEVKTPVGYIDVLTDKYVYEVKAARYWKAAIGQVLSYHVYYPNHKPRLYLYGKPPVTKKLIEDQCKAHGIVVVWHRDGPVKPRQPKTSQVDQQFLRIELHMQQKTPYLSSRMSYINVMKKMQKYENEMFLVNVKRIHYIQIPPEPRSESDLQSYLDTLRDILDPLLDNQINLRLHYKAYGDDISVNSVREYRQGTMVHSGLVLLGNREGARYAEEPIILRFPGLRDDLITVGIDKARTQYLNDKGIAFVRPLIEFVLQPSWKWQSSSTGHPIAKVTSFYPYRYKPVPSTKRDLYYSLKEK